MNNERRTQANPQEKGTCLECGHKYPKKREWQKFCSDACRMASFRKRHPRISPSVMRDIEDLKKSNEDLVRQIQELRKEKADLGRPASRRTKTENQKI